MFSIYDEGIEDVKRILAFGKERRTPSIPKGYILSDKQKCQPKKQNKFVIKGVEIMAASRKDAIKKFNHLKGE